MCPKGKQITYDNNNNDNSKCIVRKSGNDDMRAFFDFCMDFMTDDRVMEMDVDYSDMDVLLKWCEEPELLKMAIIDIKNRKKG